MILADSSAWVEFDRATGSRFDRRIQALLVEGAELAVTEPVALEVLAGPRTDDAAERWRRLLGRVALLPFRSPEDFESATAIYRRCRRAGVTPRGLLDCLIAAVALRTDASLLTGDADLVRIAEVVGIELA